MPDRRQFIQAVPALALGSLGVHSGTLAQANAWPTRPIRIIVPSTPASGSDIIARTFAEYLAAQTGQATITDNRPGANTMIGAEAAKNAAPDGYTFFCAGTSSHSANPALYSKLRYDPAKDFVNVGMFGVFSYLVVVRKDSPYRSIADLIDAAKARPGKISSGYSGSSSQVPLELLKAMAGVDIVTAGYRGAPQVINDIAAGSIDFAILTGISSGSSTHGGLLRAIGITSATRTAQMPDLPAVAEKVPGFVYEGWVGLAAPAATPMPIVARMNGYVRAGVAAPAMRKVLDGLGVVPKDLTIAQHEEFAATERKHFAQLVRIARIPRLN